MTVALILLAVLVPGVPVAEQFPPAPLGPDAERRLLDEIAEQLETDRALALEQRADSEDLAEPPRGEQPAAPYETHDTYNIPEPWRSLADCESGDWIDGGRSFVEGSARWHSGHSDPARDERPPWSNGLFYGGLQFERASWDWASDLGGHGLAGTNPADHPPSVQIAHAETLRQHHPAGWGAWPRCSRLVGLR